MLRKVTWVKPQIIVEVKFTEWTEDGILRHPSYQGLRTDKHESEISQELPISDKSDEFNLTHPDKILYPKVHITKLDLANYYEKIATHIIPYILIVLFLWFDVLKVAKVNVFFKNIGHQACLRV